MKRLFRPKGKGRSRDNDRGSPPPHPDSEATVRSSPTMNTIPKADMDNARKGVIYLWKGITVNEPPLPENEENEVGHVEGTVAMIKERIKEWSRDLVEKTYSQISKVFGGDTAAIASTLLTLSSYVAQHVFQNLAPVIGSAETLVRSLRETTAAFIEKFRLWKASREVKFVDGHPKTIVKGIETGMNRSLLQGLYELAKSSLILSFDMASLGGTETINAVASVIEAVTKFLWRLAEVRMIRGFARDAAECWPSCKDDKAGSIHLDPIKFDEWLKAVTERVPVVAAITLRSGIAGDKMRLLQMYNGKNVVITQSEFDKGVKYLDKMKQKGIELIDSSGIKFDSNDAMVRKLLHFGEK